MTTLKLRTARPLLAIMASLTMAACTTTAPLQSSGMKDMSMANCPCCAQMKGPMGTSGKMPNCCAGMTEGKSCGCCGGGSDGKPMICQPKN